MDKFKLNELLYKYSKTFEKPLELVTIFINRDKVLQRKLIKLLESSIKNKKEVTKKDIEEFYPTTEGIII
tara:strand:+ start:664 stop:873 length:210 start_codon:yes stop_codon:yes gene_type:complete